MHANKTQKHTHDEHTHDVGCAVHVIIMPCTYTHHVIITHSGSIVNDDVLDRWQKYRGGVDGARYGKVAWQLWRDIYLHWHAIPTQPAKSLIVAGWAGLVD
jgi:hypothetical protein